MHSSGQYVHSLLLYYLCDIIGGQISTALQDESEKQYMDAPEWVNLEGIDQVKFYNSVDSLAILEKAQKTRNTYP